MRTALFLTAALVLGGSTCKRSTSEADWKLDPPRPTELPVVKSERPPSETAHPRIVLTDEALARVKRHAEADSPLWHDLQRQCNEFAKKDMSSGYLGAFWGDAIAALTLCWYTTGEQKWHDKAFRYLDALLDDKRKIGDGEGGNDVVHGNSGYPIRNFGVYTALAYDWLHDAPGMTDARKAKIKERLGAWIDWYQKEGYLNDNPYSNYFWGYFTTLSMASLAVHGEDPAADAWLAETRRLFEEEIVPGFYAYLRGGAWAEGWQYGQLVAVEAALLVRGFQTAAGTDYSSNLPWLSELVDSRLFRLRPDGKSDYGNGTQHDNPSEPKSLALYAAHMILERSDPDKAKEARFLLRELYPELHRKESWFGVLSVDPGDVPAVDPRDPERLSYHMKGPGLTLARSSWEPDSIWVSFQAGPKIATDHQHQDQGHFEIWRGSDGLVVDSGGGNSSATINHNSLLISGEHRLLPYAPNQGVWGRKVATRHVADDGEVLVAVGDLTDAWSPKCVKRGCDDSAVESVTRTFVYLRPNVVVTNDEVTLADGDDPVTWAAHLRSAPKARGRHVSSTFGSSRIDITGLLPATGVAVARKEPTESDDHVFRANTTAYDAWRVELATKTGKDDRRLRVWLAAGAADAPPSYAKAITGRGLGGAIGAVGERTMAVLFADSGVGGMATLPASGADSVVVTGLEPGKHYDATMAQGGAGCDLTLARSDTGKLVANDGGFVRVGAKGCTLL